MKSENIYGIGTDIIEVKRVKNAIERYPNFILKVFTPAESSYCEGKKELNLKYICYAERFAAKEAVAKSLGTGLGKNVYLTEIEVISLAGGKPVINITGRSKDFCNTKNIKRIEISLTGIQKYAIAFAVAIV